MGYSYKDGGSDRDEGFHLAEGNLKRLYVLAAFLKGLDCLGLIAGEVPGWKQGKVRGEMRQFGMKLTSKGLDELPHCVSDVGHQCVTLRLRHEAKL